MKHERAMERRQFLKGTLGVARGHQNGVASCNHIFGSSLQKYFHLVEL